MEPSEEQITMSTRDRAKLILQWLNSTEPIPTYAVRRAIRKLVSEELVRNSR